MMIVYSPLIGWGFFSFGGEGHELAASDPLYLGSPVIYILVTLNLHGLYGPVVGWLNPAWIEFHEAK